MLTPGQPLKFSPGDLKRLSRGCLAIIEDAETQHSPLLDNIRTWWEWYDAKPLTKTRNDPWANSSNVVVPLIRIHADAVISRKSNTIFAANDLWVARNRNEAIKDFVKPTVNFLNWAADDNEFDLFMPSLDWFTESVILGTSVLALNWVVRKKQMFLPGEGGKPKAINVELSRGPHFEQVPRESILWQADRELQDAEYVIRQSWKSWGDIARMSNKDLYGELAWDMEAAEKIKGFNQSGTSRTGNIRESKLAASGMTPTGPEAYEPYDMRDVWIEWPVVRSFNIERLPGEQNPDDPVLPLVVTLHRDTGEILRVIAKPYMIAGWPFYDITYRREGRRAHTGGLAKILEHMQRATTTMLNQSIDTITLANSVLGVTTDPKIANDRWAPNKMILAQSKDDFEPITLSKLIQPDVVMINLVMGFAERVTGINDPNLGKETRLGGHPSPATSTLTLLNESREILRTSQKADRMQYGRIAEDVLTLYQQFETDSDGKLERVLGSRDAEMAQRIIFPTDQTIAGNIQFDLRAMSDTLNPEEERNKALFVQQVTSDYYARVLQGLQVAIQSLQFAEHPIGQKLVEASLKSIEAFTESYSRVLENSSIDEVEKFVFDIKGASNARQQAGAIRESGASVEQLLGGVAQGGQGPAVPTGNAGLPLASGGAAVGSGLG